MVYDGQKTSRSLTFVALDTRVRHTSRVGNESFTEGRREAVTNDFGCQ